MSKRGSNIASKHGAKWIRKDKREAIYMRDGYACLYCGKHRDALHDPLQLDHLKPYSEGGDNHESNLITCCKPCNVARGTQSVEAYVHSIASPRRAQAVLKRIYAATSRFDLKFLREEAKKKGQATPSSQLFQPEPLASREPADFL